MTAKNHDRDSDDEKNKAGGVQKWMKVVVQQPARSENKSERQRDQGHCKAHAGSDRFPRNRIVSKSSIHETNLRPSV